MQSRHLTRTSNSSQVETETAIQNYPLCADLGCAKVKVHIFHEFFTCELRFLCDSHAISDRLRKVARGRTAYHVRGILAGPILLTSHLVGRPIEPWDVVEV